MSSFQAQVSLSQTRRSKCSIKELFNFQCFVRIFSEQENFDNRILIRNTSFVDIQKIQIKALLEGGNKPPNRSSWATNSQV